MEVCESEEELNSVEPGGNNSVFAFFRIIWDKWFVGAFLFFFFRSLTFVYVCFKISASKICNIFLMSCSLLHCFVNSLFMNASLSFFPNLTFHFPRPFLLPSSLLILSHQLRVQIGELNLTYGHSFE